MESILGLCSVGSGWEAEEHVISSLQFFGSSRLLNSGCEVLDGNRQPPLSNLNPRELVHQFSAVLWY